MDLEALPRLRAFHGMSPDADRLWRHGDDTGGPEGRREYLGDPPIPGDLWIASLDEDDFGPVDTALLLVTEVREDNRYVLAAPVTQVVDGEGPAEPGHHLSSAVLSVDIAAHPAFAAAVPYPALHRRLGTEVEAFHLHRLRAEAPSPDAYPEAQAAELRTLMTALFFATR